MSWTKRPTVAPRPEHFPFPEIPASLTFRNPATESNPTSEPHPQIQTPAHTANITTSIRIATNFATISFRERSFHEWPHTNLPPQQLARLGFYHKPADDGRYNVCCFACEAEVLHWDLVRSYTEEELLDHHNKDCLWADMCRDARRCAQDSGVQTTTYSPLQTNLPATQTTRLQAQPTPTTPSTKTVKPTYAAVLKAPSRPRPLQLDPKSPPSTPRSPSPSVLNKPDIYQAKQIDCLADEPSRQMERARFEIVA
jgi:hypothetical protein